MFSRKLLWIITWIVASNAWALPDDSKQNIHIEADQVDIDDRNGVSTYSGKVQLIQGSIRLTADNIVVHTENRVLVKIIANGKPSTFRQKPEAGKLDVVAKALQLEYLARDGKLILTRSASLNQGMNMFSGNRILYDLNQSYVRAESDDQSSQRVQVVIQPSTLEE
ncbi:MAG: lipopolysaccharide transport periplasmic protein LptA [Gammaproteobacteria bacterium]|nr:lipopolysaccharide transport periplasmic protein LptA [Gammaproteobacteria bacterium]